MIYSLFGKIIEKNQTNIVLDIGNISFDILYCSFESIEIGEERKILIHEIYNEDEHYLVGFNSIEEKELFLLLLDIKGIGVKTASSLIKGANLDTILGYIENKEYGKLVKISGIGKVGASLILGNYNALMAKNNKKEELSKEKDEARQALVSLGYKEKEFMGYLINNKDADSAVITKSVLQKLSKKEVR